MSVEEIGPHKQAEFSQRKGIDGRYVVKCRDCGTSTHHRDQHQAKKNLSNYSCSPNCENCNNLRRSNDTRPAVPAGGSCDDILHTCPNDGNRWWQGSTLFHQWQNVTDNDEWTCLNDSLRQHEKAGFGISF